MLIDIIYFTIILLSLPYILFKVITNKRYRTGFVQRLGFIDKRVTDKPCIWVHGSSVGEVLTSRTLINKIEKTFPKFDVVVSAWTDTGVETAKKKFKDKYSFYFPIDFSFIVKRFFKKIKPDYIILIELEIWPNFFITATKCNIPIIVVNGRISDKSVRFYRKLSFFSKDFRNSLIDNKVYCARTESDASRFKQLDVSPENINVTGTMKYDNIDTIGNDEQKAYLQNLFGINNDDLVIVGGSTRDGEEEILINVFSVLQKEVCNLRLIIVPRHIDRTNNIIALIKKSGSHAVRKTDLKTKESESLKDNTANTIIVIDTIGELIDIYALADCVFVGGSLSPYGGQNVMEPAGLAKPVVFGPHMFNFEEEAKLLLKNDAAKSVNNESELLDAIRSLLTNPMLAGDMGTRAQNVVVNNKGATGRNLEILKKFFN